MEEQKCSRSFPGCMKGLVHFLDLHQHLHLRKMKMLTYRRHGEGKRAARNKEPKADPDAPSTSLQYVCPKDTCFGLEDKASTRKHPVKSSIRLSFPKWRLREHNKKIKVPPPASAIEQNENANKASSSSERVYILSSSFDEHNFDEHCADNMAYSKSGSSGPSQPDELENISQMKQLHLSNSNAKELQEDVILHPSKEFLAMMKLFNGNIGLIQSILDDPSFIFAHYLQAKQASNAELTRAYSFPAPWQLERRNDGRFQIKHKRYESESLVRQSVKFHSENLSTHTDEIEEDMPKEEVIDGEEERGSKLVETNFIPFMAIKHNKKAHHRIFMDGILHKIPFGRMVMEAMRKSKSGWWDKSTMEKLEGEGSTHSSWSKIDKRVKKNIQRSQSLNDYSDKYSHLYESISQEEFKRLPERMKVKSLGRICSLPDIKYCSWSKNTQSEAPFSSPKHLTTSHREKILEKEESKEFNTEVSSKWMAIDCGKVPFQSDEKEQCETCLISKKLTKDGLLREENRSITPQGEKLMDEACTYELIKPTPISSAGSVARGDVSLGFLDYAVSEGLEHRYPSEHPNIFDIDGLETNEIDLAKEKPSPNIDCFNSFHLQIDQKDEKFNYVREILKRSRISGCDFLGAWHSPPYQPMGPLIFNETDNLSYELEITEDEEDISLEHHLLFDLINEILVEIYENFFVSFSSFLPGFNTNTRTMPMGNHILEEIWEKILWHLEDQTQLGIISLEEIVSRNFTKNDGWMNIQCDIDDVEIEIECLILDALLDEVALQLSLLPGSNPIPS